MTANLPKDYPVPVIVPARRISSKVAVLAGLVAAYLSCIFALGHFAHVSPGVGLCLQIGLSAGLLAATFAVCLRWWRHKDEAQQEAQKWAWYWGGAFGLAVVLPILFVMTFENDRALSAALTAIGAADDVGMAFKLGVMATLVPMCVGAFIARAVWWRRHR